MKGPAAKKGDGKNGSRVGSLVINEFRSLGRRIGK